MTSFGKLIKIQSGTIGFKLNKILMWIPEEVSSVDSSTMFYFLSLFPLLFVFGLPLCIIFCFLSFIPLSLSISLSILLFLLMFSLPPSLYLLPISLFLLPFSMFSLSFCVPTFFLQVYIFSLYTWRFIRMVYSLWSS